ncbi:MAG: hypothetical protein FJY95_22300 [Candidatus Handelsmanbacteria bacterium]|nr:hypothetical protein [Candidatus Handelsmanbacteria bacterium]
MSPQCSTVPPPIGWNAEHPLEDRIRFATSEAEPERLVEEIQAGFEVGHLAQDQVEHLVVLAGQQAHGLLETAEEERLGDLLRRQPVAQVYSRLLDEDVLLAADDAQVPGDSQLVDYRESELPQVVGRTPAQVQAIHAVKVVFDGQLVGEYG